MSTTPRFGKIHLKESFGTLPNRTLLDVLKLRYKEVLDKWDGYDYKVFGPLSFDDTSHVSVWLINKDHTYNEINIPLIEGLK